MSASCVHSEAGPTTHTTPHPSLGTPGSPERTVAVSDLSLGKNRTFQGGPVRPEADLSIPRRVYLSRGGRVYPAVDLTWAGDKRIGRALKLSTLERKTDRAHQIGETKQTETTVGCWAHLGPVRVPPAHGQQAWRNACALRCLVKLMLKSDRAERGRGRAVREVRGGVGEGADEAYGGGGEGMCRGGEHVEGGGGGVAEDLGVGGWVEGLHRPRTKPARISQPCPREIEMLRSRSLVG